MTDMWLPEGAHWGLHITHRPINRPLAFTGGGWKVVWHTTEGSSLNGADEALAASGEWPQLLIEPSAGTVVQYQPLDQAGRSLRHPAGAAATNTANAIQVEIVGKAATSGRWGQRTWDNLGALAALIRHRHPVPDHWPDPWNRQRMSSMGFVAFAGHCGHMHVPGNDHVDPGAEFHIDRLLSARRKAQAAYG